MSGTGPRRGVRTVTATGGTAIQWSDGAVEAADGSGGGMFGGGATGQRMQALGSKAKTTLTVAASSINLFSRPVVSTDPDLVRASRNKTRIFLAIFPIIVIIIVTADVLSPQVNSTTLTRPAVGDYLAAVEYVPECPCSALQVPLGPSLSLTFPPAANYTANACRTIMAVVTKCYNATDGWPLGADACVGTTDAGAMLFGGVLQPAAAICAALVNGQAHAVMNIVESQLPTFLQTPEVYNATAMRAVLVEAQKLQEYSNTLFQTLQTANILQLLTSPVYDIAWGSVFRTPANCTCDLGGPSVPAGSSPRTWFPQNSSCHFRALFDTTPGPAGDDRYTCNLAATVLRTPLVLLQYNSTYESMGLPPPYDDLTRFARLNPSDDTEGMYAALVAANNLFQEYSGATLQPGVATGNFAAYFATCAPSTCTYTYVGIQPGTKGLVAAFGTSH